MKTLKKLFSRIVIFGIALCLLAACSNSDEIPECRYIKPSDVPGTYVQKTRDYEEYNYRSGDPLPLMITISPNKGTTDGSKISHDITIAAIKHPVHVPEIQLKDVEFNLAYGSYEFNIEYTCHDASDDAFTVSIRGSVLLSYGFGVSKPEIRGIYCYRSAKRIVEDVFCCESQNK